MLGETLSDPEGVEGGGEMAGLGLLPCRTVFAAQKTRTRVDAVTAVPFLEDVSLRCYEIHMGLTQRLGGVPFARFPDGREEGAAAGKVLGTYLHGLFDTGALVEQLAAWLMKEKGLTLEHIRVESQEDYRERQYDRLARVVREHLDMKAVYRAMEEYQ